MPAVRLDNWWLTDGPKPELTVHITRRNGDSVLAVLRIDRMTDWIEPFRLDVAPIEEAAKARGER